MTEQAEAARRAAVRVVRATEPGAEARRIAEELGGDVVEDLRSAEREIRVRVEAGRAALGDRTADEALLRRADAIRSAADQPAPISPEQVAELERLARDLARAARIRQRTEARFVDALQARLATSAGLTIHPEAIRSAARGVAEAEESVAVADQALADLGEEPPSRAAEAAPPAEPEPEPETEPTRRPRLAHAAPLTFDHGEGPDPVLQRPHDVFDELALDKRRATTRGLAVFVLLAGLGVLAVFFDQTVLGAVLLLAAAAAGGVIGLRGHHAATQQDADRVDAAARLGSLSTSDRAVLRQPEPEPAWEPELTWEREPEPEPEGGPELVADDHEAPDPDVVWLQQRTALLAERSSAAELLRVTLARWRQLAGADADPHDPEPVIRANDPQLHYDSHLAEVSPTVRTVAAFHRSVQARWRVLWASFGVDDPPEPVDLASTLEDLLGDSARAAAELRELEAAELRVGARAVVGRPSLIHAVGSTSTRGRLAQLLSSIPPEGQAVVVEREPTGVS